MVDGVTISAPARLHFGLFSIGQSLEYQFGGCGLMIDGPRTRVAVRSSDQLLIAGPESKTAAQTIQHWFKRNQVFLTERLGISSATELPVAIDIQQIAPRHAGFGSGTQLALSVIASVCQLLNLPQMNPAELAVAAGRGKRSAIGSYGFQRGGFLVDRGKGDHDAVSSLELRLDFPNDWPVITILLPVEAGLSGSAEKMAFDKLPQSDDQHRQSMLDMTKQQIVPGIINRDYGQFAEGLFVFGYRSGLMFESLQGGAYNGPSIATAVEQLRALGILAAGQSSWGPCVFGIAPSIELASDVIPLLVERLPAETVIRLHRADNQGAMGINSSC